MGTKETITIFIVPLLLVIVMTLWANPVTFWQRLIAIIFGAISYIIMVIILANLSD